MKRDFVNSDCIQYFHKEHRMNIAHFFFYRSSLHAIWGCYVQPAGVRYTQSNQVAAYANIAELFLHTAAAKCSSFHCERKLTFSIPDIPPPFVAQSAYCTVVCSSTVTSARIQRRAGIFPFVEFGP